VTRALEACARKEPRIDGEIPGSFCAQKTILGAWSLILTEIGFVDRAWPDTPANFVSI
jgi:hypothetical protein